MEKSVSNSDGSEVAISAIEDNFDGIKSGGRYGMRFNEFFKITVKGWSNFLSTEDQLIWSKLARDHSTLCNLLYDFEKFLSPLIFCSYGINIYYACLQVRVNCICSFSAISCDNQKYPNCDLIRVIEHEQFQWVWIINKWTVCLHAFPTAFNWSDSRKEFRCEINTLHNLCNLVIPPFTHQIIYRLNICS